MDCGLILAPTPTTKSSSWLCHATYRNLGAIRRGRLDHACSVWLRDTSPEYRVLGRYRQQRPH